MAILQFIKPTKRKIKIFIIEIIIILLIASVGYYMYSLHDSGKVKFSLFLEMVGFILVAPIFMLYIATSSLLLGPLYEMGFTWVFQGCEFIGICPSLPAIIFILVPFWIILLYLFACQVDKRYPKKNN